MARRIDGQNRAVDPCHLKPSVTNFGDPRVRRGELARAVQVKRAFNWDYHESAQLVLCSASFLNLPNGLTVNPESAALIKQTP